MTIWEYNPLKNQDDELPSSLFRYRSSKRIVEELRFMNMRFSKISSFNDPFDGQLLSKRRFSDDDFLKILRLEAERAIQENRLVKPATDANPVHVLLWHFNQMQMLGSSISQRKFLDFIICRLKEKGFSFGPTDYERGVVCGFADILRCICFTRNKGNLLMWAHYGENHRGAVVEFKIPSDSVILRNPVSVRYSQTIPDSDEVTNFAMSVLGFSQSDRKKIDRILYTKSIDWSYEDEWRVYPNVKSDISENEEGKFSSNDVVALYFGCRMDMAVRRELLDIVDQKYPNAIVFQAQKNEREYFLDFLPIRTPGRECLETDEKFPDQLLALYSQCVEMFYRGLNDPLGARESWAIDCLRLDAALTLPVQRDIRLAFRAMLDSADIFARQRREDRAGVSHPYASEIERSQALRAAALPYRKFHELADAHLHTFERQLKPI